MVEISDVVADSNVDASLMRRIAVKNSAEKLYQNLIVEGNISRYTPGRILRAAIFMADAGLIDYANELLRHPSYVGG